MDTEQLTLNKSSDRQAIEGFHAFVVEQIAQLQQAFIFESIIKIAAGSAWLVVVNVREVSSEIATCEKHVEIEPKT